tara:strand:- start:17 stop:232 length:216 start_codon:yes stop_codon:yes gene_type:complete
VPEINHGKPVKREDLRNSIRVHVIGRVRKIIFFGLNDSNILLNRNKKPEYKDKIEIKIRMSKDEPIMLIFP